MDRSRSGVDTASSTGGLMRVILSPVGALENHRARERQLKGSPKVLSHGRYPSRARMWELPSKTTL